MESCTKCGQELGVGAFCPGCGQPVDGWRTGTAERPAVDVSPVPATPPPTRPTPPRPVVPVVPPPAPSLPREGARYPLFADEVPDATSAHHLPPATARHQPTHQAPHRRRTPAWLPWAAGLAALLLVAGVGVGLLTAGDDADPADQAEGAADATSSATDGPSASDQPSGEPGDLARLASAQVPATAPPNQDISGNMVRYEARNMLDGVRQTCWRMPGDGTGDELTFQLADPTTLTSVGLVNGYAKLAKVSGGRPLDWYHGNRRVLRVEWVFDDGSTVRQSLADSRRMQSVEVDPVTTQTVRLRLVEVSAPGRGRAARNNTAISDVSLVGSSA